MSYSDRPRFYYPTAPNPQLALPGVHIKRERHICGDGHIVMRYHGEEAILCGATIPGIKKKHGGGAYHANRVPGTNICKKCQKVFKSLPDGNYQKFVQEGNGNLFVPPTDRVLEVPTDTRYEKEGIMGVIRSSPRIRILDAIDLFWERNSYPPTIRDIAKRAGFSPKSTGTVWYYLNNLAIEGSIIIRDAHPIPLWVDDLIKKETEKRHA